ncbi:MAG TPA: nucleotidyltransferase domain-containing protein [Spirochaetota bacterium]|nr:nucleotidyltransferase domain-containing protein [Spirochaetota bacterium]HPV42797.1 nucleotidyltransferase domain-containing protein [Spirochaetota bacterium]
MSPLENTIKEKIKNAVLSNISDAEIFIYGSRARGEASMESDWDVMVITPHAIAASLKNAIRHALYEVEWDYACVISSIIHSREEWDNPLMKMTPFHRNVTRDAIRL